MITSSMKLILQLGTVSLASTLTTTDFRLLAHFHPVTFASYHLNKPYVKFSLPANSKHFQAGPGNLKHFQALLNNSKQFQAIPRKSNDKHISLTDHPLSSCSSMLKLTKMSMPMSSSVKGIITFALGLISSYFT